MPKTEAVEKNIKLKIIFKFNDIYSEKNEDQLLIVKEIKIIYKNFIYLNLSDFIFFSESKFKTIGNKNILCINL